MNKQLIALAACIAALQGCATPTSAPQVAGEDLNIGIAKSCTASKVDVSAANTASATIAMTNDGWCAVRLTEKDGKPFQLGLVRARPDHGRVLIQKMGGETRLEYSAENRYVGTDRFTVALRSKTQGAPDTTIQVAVTVTMGEAAAVAPPPPAAAAPARTPTRTPPRPARPATQAR